MLSVNFFNIIDQFPKYTDYVEFRNTIGNGVEYVDQTPKVSTHPNQRCLEKIKILPWTSFQLLK